MASKITDIELRNQALELTDPREQRGIVTEIQEGVALLQILNTYAFERYPAEKVHCVHCRKRCHKYGFSALLSSGGIALLGSTCGHRLFQETWLHTRKRFKDKIDRQYELRQLDRFGLLKDLLINSLVSWYRPLDLLQARRRAFEKNFGELFSRLREARARGDSGLSRFERYRDLAAEQNREGDNDRAIWKTRELPPVFVGGLDWIQDGDFIKRLDLAIIRLREYGSLLHSTDGHPTSALSKARRRVRDAMETVEELVRIHTSIFDFFTTQNIDRIVTWTTTSDSYRGVRIDDTHKLQAPPQDFPELDQSVMELITEFRRAD